MSEMAKTIVLVFLAIGSLSFAFVVGPGNEGNDFDELIGARLNNFEVGQAKRLKIVKFEQETASRQEFEIAEVDGLWTIPSKQGYPADANKRMAEAVNNVIDREILRIAARSASEHNTLGVLNPESSKLNSKSSGAGTRIVISDENDNVLSDMIIGKPVPESENQYHVRDTDKDLVYVVNLNPENLSTSFKDWIEGDLLKLNPLDLQEIDIHDYSVELRPVLAAGGFTMQVLWDRRGEFLLEYDKSESEWGAKRLKRFDAAKNELVEFKLAEDEELNKDALQELRDSLEDLLIVDVERKPAGLSADLQAGEGFLNDNDAVESLGERGFAAVSLQPGTDPEILSSEGQLICSLSDGIEYVLRFGNMKSDSQETGSSQDSKNPDGTMADSQNSGSNIYRYLFVMARFNELLLASPELEEFPALPEGITEEDLEAAAAAAEKSQETETEETPTAGSPSSDSESSEESPVEKTEEEEEEEEAEGTAETASENDPTAVETEVTAEATSETDSTEAETEESQTANAAETDEDEAEKKAEEMSRILAVREGIIQENERKQNEYQDKIKASKERMQELNERFGDWYYVIDNAVYKKIHLGSEQLIRKKEKEEDMEAGNGSGAAANGLPGLPNLPVGNP